MLSGSKRKVVLVDVVASGKRGGAARAAVLTAAELAESSRHAASARWAAYYKKHPDKWKARLAKEAKKGSRKKLQNQVKTVA